MTAFSIFIRPKTIQGARPISVKIHPELLATYGRTRAGTRSARRRGLAGTWPRIVAVSAAAARTSMSIPAPTIARKVQYVHLTGGA